MNEPPKTLKGVKHYDFLTLAGDVEITPQGFIKVPIYASRTGVYEYMQKDGSIRRELCPPETLFSPESMATLVDAPITNNHRTDIIPDGFVTPQYVAQVSVGHVSGEPVQEGQKFLKVVGVVMEKKAIEDVRNGKREVSPGYESDVEFSPGLWHDPETGQEMPYDAIQRNRVYNHLAIVDSAREGHDVRIRLDSADVEVYIERRTKEPQQRSRTMAKTLKQHLDDDAPVEKIPVNVGDEVHGKPGKPTTKVKMAEEEFEMDADVARYVHKLHGAFLAGKKKNDDDKKALDEMKQKMDEMSVELAKHHDDDDKDAKEKKMDALTKEIKDLKKRLDDASDRKRFLSSVNARLELVGTAVELIGEKKFKELKLDEADDLEIMKAVIKLDDAKAVLDDKTKEYVEGAFAGIKSRVKGAIRNDSVLGKAIIDAGAGGTYEAAALEAREKARNAYKSTPKNAATKAGARALTESSQQAGK